MDKILLADDDREFCELLVEYLNEQGFSATAVHDGEAALAALRAQDGDGDDGYRALVLDVMMPRLDGLETLRQLRQQANSLPVIMLTARGEDIDRIVGLELGADDYVPKPANPRELVARLRAVLRRSQPEPADRPPENEIRVGDLRLATDRRQARLNQQPLELTTAEFDVLAALAAAAGQVVGKDALALAALGRRLGPYDRSLDMHLVNLRRKLGPASDGGERIKTVRNRGYLYLPPAGAGPAG